MCLVLHMSSTSKACCWCHPLVWLEYCWKWLTVFHWFVCSRLCSQRVFDHSENEILIKFTYFELFSIFAAFTHHKNKIQGLLTYPSQTTLGRYPTSPCSTSHHPWQRRWTLNHKTISNKVAQSTSPQPVSITWPCRHSNNMSPANRVLGSDVVMRKEFLVHLCSVIPIRWGYPSHHQ